MCTFNVIPNKTPAIFFVDIEDLILKCIWKDTGPIIATISLTNNFGGRITQRSRGCGITARTDRDQWDRIENPEITTVISLIVFSQRCKSYSVEERHAFP